MCVYTSCTHAHTACCRSESGKELPTPPLVLLLLLLLLVPPRLLLPGVLAEGSTSLFPVSLASVYCGDEGGERMGATVKCV